MGRSEERSERIKESAGVARSAVPSRWGNSPFAIARAVIHFLWLLMPFSTGQGVDLSLESLPVQAVSFSSSSHYLIISSMIILGPKAEHE